MCTKLESCGLLFEPFDRFDLACFSCLALHDLVSKADLKRSFNSACDPNYAN